MINKVSNCVGCGLSPCYNCEGYELICDDCECEVYELYKFEGYQLCHDCFSKAVLEDAFENAEMVTVSDYED